MKLLSMICATDIAERLSRAEWKSIYWRGNSVERIYVTSRVSGACGFIQLSIFGRVTEGLFRYRAHILQAAGLPLTTPKTT